MIKYRLFLMILAVITFSTELFAQQDNNNTGRRFQMPEGNGTISGIVVDKDSHAPLEGTVVTLFTAKDSTRVKGAGTDNKGIFKIEAPYGAYKLEANYIGYNIAYIN